MAIFQMLMSNLKKQKQKIKPTVSYPKLGKVKPRDFGLDLSYGVAARGISNPHWALIHAATENENPLEI